MLADDPGTKMQDKAICAVLFWYPYKLCKVVPVRPCNIYTLKMLLRLFFFNKSRE